MNDGVVIAIVKGGLGNQLFIYAAARAMAVRMGRQLYLDTVRGYTADAYGRCYRLNRFPIQVQEMPEAWRIAPDLRHLRHKWIRALNKFLPQPWQSYVAERADSSPAQIRQFRSRRARVTLLGYWQNEAYFADMAEQLRLELAPPAPADPALCQRGAALAECNSVFVHIRRIDYAALLGVDYYQKAIDAARSVIDAPVFVLFGDDLRWAQDQLDFGGATVESQHYNATDEMTDLWLMSRCRHAIIANSSFSWWGAWLGGPANGTRKVWAPDPTGLPLVRAPGWHGVPASLEYPDRK